MVIFTLAAIAVTGALAAQSSPKFEAASVKRSKGDRGVRVGCRGIDSNYPPEHMASAPPLGRCVISGALLDQMLAFAYHFRFTESIKGGPRWAREGSVRFDVEAVAEDPAKTTDAELYQMLRALLIERFQIQSHTETEERPGFVLRIGKNGPKLRESSSDEVASFKYTSGHPVTLVARKYSMKNFAQFFEMRSWANGPVIDRTGLTGNYDFTLSWGEEQGPSLSTALRELGLRLDPEKVPVPFLVIDSAQPPGGN